MLIRVNREIGQWDRLPAFERLPRRPASFVAPRLMPRELDGPSLALWRFQSRGAYDHLRRDGVLVVDPAAAEPDFVEAYGWMWREMARRLPTSGEAALWGWARNTRQALVQTARHARGEVLLSHFRDWHAALNRSLGVAPLPGETEEQWSARFELAHDSWGQRVAAFRDVRLGDWPPHLRHELEASWDYIFDPSWWGVDDPVQGTVHSISRADVVKAVRVT